MPTARELLEQAEALMQRDRAALLGDGIPTLTDSVPTPGGVVPGLDTRHAPTTLDDIPMLTETIEDFDTPSIPLAQALDDELALWRNSGDASPEVTADDARTGSGAGRNSRGRSLLIRRAWRRPSKQWWIRRRKLRALKGRQSKRRPRRSTSPRDGMRSPKTFACKSCNASTSSPIPGSRIS
jgi:hypothetical protein